MNKTYKTDAKLFKLMQMNWCGYGLKQTILLTAKTPSTAHELHCERTST